MKRVLFLCTANYWHVHDIDCEPPEDAIPVLEQKVSALVRRRQTAGDASG